MSYLIGDTIRLTATIKDFEGMEVAPDAITVTVYNGEGEKLLDGATPTLKTGTTSHYYYDWEVSGVEVKSDLVAVWEWTGPHKKKITLKVEPVIEASV